MNREFTFSTQPAIDIALLIKRNESNEQLLRQLLAFAKQLEAQPIDYVIIISHVVGYINRICPDSSKFY